MCIDPTTTGRGVSNATQRLAPSPGSASAAASERRSPCKLAAAVSLARSAALLPSLLRASLASETPGTAPLRVATMAAAARPDDEVVRDENSDRIAAVSSSPPRIVHAVFIPLSTGITGWLSRAR